MSDKLVTVWRVVLYPSMNTISVHSSMGMARVARHNLEILYPDSNFWIVEVATKTVDKGPLANGQ